MKRTGQTPGRPAPLRRRQLAAGGWRRLPARRGRFGLGRRPVRGAAGGKRRGAVKSFPAGLRTSVVVAGGSGGETLVKALAELSRLQPDEIVVVLHGDGKAGLELIRMFPEAAVVHAAEPLGQGEQRCAGAKMAEGDAMLVVDGTVPADARRLLPLLKAVRSGTDVALTRVEENLGPFSAWNDTMRLRAFMNSGFGRPDLGASSMSDLPYALSRRALRALGAEALAAPAKAQAEALALGLRVRTCARTAGGSFKGSGGERPEGDSRRGRYVEEHIEALCEAMSRSGARLALTDAERRRSAAGGAAP